MGTGHDRRPYRVVVVRALGFWNEYGDDWRALIEVALGSDRASRAVTGGLVVRLAHHGEATVGRQTTSGQGGTRGAARVPGSR